MATVHCVRCGQERERMSFQPFPTELGKRAYDEICGTCWAEWLKLQQQLINHYALNLRDPKAKEFLLRNMEQFLFAGGQVGA
jgi:Fe-S cluster biosynthesis and repair protein YggX